MRGAEHVHMELVSLCAPEKC